MYKREGERGCARVREGECAMFIKVESARAKVSSLPHMPSPYSRDVATRTPSL